MDPAQRQSMRMIFVLLVSAVFCAIATFIAIALLLNRSDTPAVAEGEVAILVTVAGTPVSLYPDPNKVVILASESRATIALEGVGPEQETATALATFVPPTATILLPTATPAVPEVIFTSYIVQPGDNLYRLTQAYNTSIDLMALYGISSSAMVAGNVLNLPIANPSFCPGLRAHVVRDEQTVSIIARMYGTTPDAIASVNNLGPNYAIKTTQVICVP